jgi:osmotically-inducible protein OsmY
MSGETGARPGIRQSGWRWLPLAGAVLVLDQVSKAWIEGRYALYDSTVLLPILDIRRLHNPGAAFSFLADAGGWQRWFFSVLALVVSAGIVYWLRQLQATGQSVLGCGLALILGGAVLGGGLVATDRRTTGIQIEDESIELRAASRVRELATLGQVSVTSYNRLALLTGEVPGAAERAQVEQAVAKVENVRTVVNELVVAPNSSLSSRTADSALATKVKLTLVDAKDVQANAFKVVAERRVVYLMGRVTEREGQRGAELASQVSGVEKVVKVFDIVNEKDLATPSASTPAPISTAASAPSR